MEVLIAGTSRFCFISIRTMILQADDTEMKVLTHTQGQFITRRPPKLTGQKV